MTAIRKEAIELLEKVPEDKLEEVFNTIVERLIEGITSFDPSVNCRIDS